MGDFGFTFIRGVVLTLTFPGEVVKDGVLPEIISKVVGIP